VDVNGGGVPGTYVGCNPAPPIVGDGPGSGDDLTAWPTSGELCNAMSVSIAAACVAVEPMLRGRRASLQAARPHPRSAGWAPWPGSGRSAWPSLANSGADFADRRVRLLDHRQHRLGHGLTFKWGLPAEQRIDRRAHSKHVAGLPALRAFKACSGAIYPGVPIADCAPVSDAPAMSSPRANPRSAILAARKLQRVRLRFDRDEDIVPA